MDYNDFLWAKVIALVVIVSVVNFVYSFITGKSIEQVRNEADEAQQNPPKSEP